MLSCLSCTLISVYLLDYNISIKIFVSGAWLFVKLELIFSISSAETTEIGEVIVGHKIKDIWFAETMALYENQ